MPGASFEAEGREVPRATAQSLALRRSRKMSVPFLFVLLGQGVGCENQEHSSPTEQPRLLGGSDQKGTAQGCPHGRMISHGRLPSTGMRRPGHEVGGWKLLPGEEHIVGGGGS